MARRGADVIGIDLADKPLKVAQLHALEAGAPAFDTARSPPRRSPPRAGSFDVVTCMEMLEHVPDPASIVAACATLVKPGGWVFFSTINRNPKAFLFAIVGAEYVLDLLPKGTHEYARFIRPRNSRAVPRRRPRPRRAAGMNYNPITRPLPPRRRPSVNYALACQK